MSEERYLAEQIELLVQGGADFDEAGRVVLGLVRAHRADPDVTQISDVQGPVGRHGQRGGGFEAGVTGVTSVSCGI